MKALVINAKGALPQISEVPRPTPRKGDILIRVEACGLNFADLLMVRGEYQEQPEYPLVPGLEVAGTVAEVGAGVDPALTSSRIAAFPANGGLAEFVVADSRRCTPIPAGVSSRDAASVQVAYGTSHLALTRTARLKAGETLLVTGAAGGVGLTAVELGKQLGARVIGVARGPEKAAIIRKAGADVSLDSEADDISQAVKDLGGADVVYDAVGGDGFRGLVSATRPEGRILLIGFASGSLPEIRPNHLLVKNISVLGFYWGGFLKFAPHAVTESLDVIFKWLGEGRIAPHISHVLPLERAAEGLDLLRTRASTGKVVITP